MFISLIVDRAHLVLYSDKPQQNIIIRLHSYDQWFCSQEDPLSVLINVKMQFPDLCTLLLFFLPSSQLPFCHSCQDVWFQLQWWKMPQKYFVAVLQLNSSLVRLNWVTSKLFDIFQIQKLFLQSDFCARSLFSWPAPKNGNACLVSIGFFIFLLITRWWDVQS